jgi:hypothetical protein
MRALIAALSIGCSDHPSIRGPARGCLHEARAGPGGVAASKRRRRHQDPAYEDFVLECLAGKISLAQASVNRRLPMHTDDGRAPSLMHRDIRCSEILLLTGSLHVLGY